MNKAKVGVGILVAAVGTGYFLGRIHEERKSPITKIADRLGF